MIRSLLVWHFILACSMGFAQESTENPRYTFVIHGGAGTITKSSMTAEKEQAYQTSLTEALDTGYAILAEGGTALDAVEAAVKLMEDNPLFNAGRGAVFTNEERNELDASIMDGKTLKAGAVAGVTVIKNPVTAARAVMEKSEHVMMAGKGAEQFAVKHGCTRVAPSYFYTKERWEGLQKVKRADSIKRSANPQGKLLIKQQGNSDDKYGTVGAVALDKHGNLAAATSTGGMTNKRYGRIGDSPVIGAGTYANNNTCAISSTGWGEYFIRLVMAKAISDRMELAHESLQRASEELILRQLQGMGGDGGVIGVDKEGNAVMVFNTAGMYRAYRKSNGEHKVLIYREQ